MTEVASSVVHEVLGRRLLDVDQPIIDYIVNVLADEDFDFGVDGDGAFEALGELLVAACCVTDFSECRSVCSTLSEKFGKHGLVKIKPTVRSLSTPFRMDDGMDEEQAPKKKAEVFDGPVLSERDKAKLERRKRKDERQREAQFQMHLAEMEAARAGMPVVCVNHDNSGGPAVKDIHMENFNVSVGGRDLIVDGLLTLSYGRHYGLVGRNGTGKTTFLRHMALHAIDGIPPNCQILHVEQEVGGDDTTALQCVLNSDLERTQLLQEEARLLARQRELDLDDDKGTGGTEKDAISQRLEEVYKRLQLIDADSAESRAAAILAGLSFSPEMQHKATKTFSGGWRMRIALARALFIEPDLLLLDEPTNHLDLHAVLWLESHLLKWPKTIIVVSHAREFLNTVVTDILHLHGQKLTAYKGNYDTFERTREEQMKNQQKAFESNERARAHMQSFVDKFRYNAKRASLVQSRIKALERMGHVDEVVNDPDYKFEFPTPDDRPGPPIISFSDASFGYPGGPIMFKNLNFGIDLDSRIAMVGPNGIGKSTILKLIAGELQPTSGTVFRSTKGAINLLLAVYKKEFRAMGGYLTDSWKPNLDCVEHFIQAVGSYEDKIFQKRARLHQRQAERIKREKAQARRGDDAEPQVQPDLVPVSQFHGSRLASGSSPSPYQQSGSRNEHRVGRAHKVARSSSAATVGAAIVEAENSLEVEVQENKEELKAKLKEIIRGKSDVFNSKNADDDKVKLGEPGWKDRYYEEKFSAKTPEEREAVRKDVVLRYTEGLCWVMHYYYEGVCSWQWFYPYQYAPFASDLKDLVQLDIMFELGSPFKPFNQLLGVFPAASAHALPEPYRKLMTDSNSPIIDFYPTDFEVDMNGKRYSWQGIAKLPFIDEPRLLAVVAEIEHTLTAEEVRRNSIMCDMLFVASSHPLSVSIYSLDDRCKQLSNSERAEIKEQIDPQISDGMNGYLSPCGGEPCPPVFRSPVSGMEDIMDNQVICAIYRLPDAHKHITRPPAGVKFPKKIVTLGDLKTDPVLWHEDSGRRHLENRRQNHSRDLSGRHLGEAATRLVVNSLQVKADRNGYCNPMHVHPPPYPGAQHTQFQSSYGNQRFHDQGHHRMPPRGTFHPPEVQFQSSNRSYGDCGYNERHNYRDRHASSAHRHPHNGSQSNYYDRSNQMPSQHSHSTNSRHPQYQSGSHHNVGPMYPQGPIGQTPLGYGADPYQSGYNQYQSYQPSGATGHQWRGSGGGGSPVWLSQPQGGQNVERGYGHPHQAGNQYSALDRIANRRPPPP